LATSDGGGGEDTPSAKEYKDVNTAWCGLSEEEKEKWPE